MGIWSRIKQAIRRAEAVKPFTPATVDEVIDIASGSVELAERIKEAVPKKKRPEKADGNKH